ncbi:Predicted flavoprotein CzcO associated with the cation diffusion facilitator CzcD [Sphingomonas guangdongensis]|uniref:Predicted flavoprotein CzcO associated with the cation diffusion facilitator CzcD n=1 Tax=Sphingomonas guangdongensis TaxID=1141890 RepID=A0A285R0S8_9SPHN|nr:NAD(P)/FAD-dependent oxidoreductase [Sphingomonas guangdongensis]SOB87716.1 Predicted flavoprotein CzcO associated with the cation diffusion facilitator CzcD [Sphingomonas guangdongensis]
MTEHLDVLIVGAGLSGIGAAYHLQTLCPDRSYAVPEARAASGGTWDLFRYPGIRSDSDMHTLGYRFQPWREARAIADGPSILRYIRDTAVEHGIDAHIRYHHRVVAAAWESSTARWTVTVERGPDRARVTLTCGFLYLCPGYYDYERGHAPTFPGQERFAGRIIHPQFWPKDLDVGGKRVIVIGSGATAVSLVPELARTAAHVTMLQRSPSYVVARPSGDRIAQALRRVLPAGLAYAATRWKNVLLGGFFYRQMRRYPAAARKRLIGWVRDHLGPDYDVDRHFSPRYDPWDQRLCLVPDADLFTAIRGGRASVVTGTIDRFEAEGVVLASGQTIPADVVVTATGLSLKLLGGIALSVDGAPVEPARHYLYKGMMVSDVPNLALAFGYTNASWTLKADLTSAYVCRLLNTMRARGLRQATPRIADPTAIGDEPFLDFTSGYVERARHLLPKQGARAPWRLHQSYARDLLLLRFGSVDDEMEFTNPEPARTAA